MLVQYVTLKCAWQIP